MDRKHDHLGRKAEAGELRSRRDRHYATRLLHDSTVFSNDDDRQMQRGHRQAADLQRSLNETEPYDGSCWSATVPRVREAVLDRRVNVARLWRLACDAARKGEKWGQRKKSVSDAMENYYTQLRRDRRGAKQWVAEVVDVLGFFDPSADWRAVEVGLQMLDQAEGDVTGVGAELQRLEMVPASSTKNSLFKSV
jgi:hypothetical protein